MHTIDTDFGIHCVHSELADNGGQSRHSQQGAALGGVAVSSLSPLTLRHHCRANPQPLEPSRSQVIGKTMKNLWRVFFLLLLMLFAAEHAVSFIFPLSTSPSTSRRDAARVSWRRCSRAPPHQSALSRLQATTEGAKV